MYTYDDLMKILNINNKFCLKAIIYSLINNGKAFIDKQKIYVDINKVKYLWDIYLKLGAYFDFKFNTREDLIKLFDYILNKENILFNAIFCPGYTNDGYKDYVGKNNTTKLEILKDLKNKITREDISCRFNIILADIFLENYDFNKNPKLLDELEIHRDKFIEKANDNFNLNEIVLLSSYFNDEKYREGFIDHDILEGKNYENFFKNNLEFYRMMNWTEEEIKLRNDRLYTLYTLISKYMSMDKSIYLPMETMYSRSKVMTYNNVCTMYLKK